MGSTLLFLLQQVSLMITFPYVLLVKSQWFVFQFVLFYRSRYIATAGFFCDRFLCEVITFEPEEIQTFLSVPAEWFPQPCFSGGFFGCSCTEHTRACMQAQDLFTSTVRRVRQRLRFLTVKIYSHGTSATTSPTPTVLFSCDK